MAKGGHIFVSREPMSVDSPSEDEIKTKRERNQAVLLLKNGDKKDIET